MILITNACMYVYMYVCMYVCVYIYQIAHNRAIRPSLSSESFYATRRIDPPKGGSMILVTKTSCMYVCMYVCMFVCIMYVYMYVCIHLCMYVCMYVFIKLHITTQSGPVILVILCHSH